MSSDLGDPNEADDRKSTNSHKGDLVIAYNTKAGNNTLRPRVFYALYIKPNDDGNGHLIYKLSMDQILVTTKYQSIPVPEDLIETMNKTNSSDNKIQINHFNSNQSVVWDDHSNNNDDDSQTSSNDKDNSAEDGSHSELDSSQQLKDLKSNKIVDHEDQVMLTKESNNSTSVSMTGLTSTSTFLQCLFLQYLHKTIITILCLRHLYKGISTVVYLLSSLQFFLQISLQENILRCTYKGISTTVHLLLSLLTSLRCKVLQPSLHAYLQSEFLQSFLLASLRDYNYLQLHL